MRALNPKFLLHTAEYQLPVETHSWYMNGYYPRFDAIIQTYKLFISEYFHGTLLINMLKSMDPYLQQKVIKKPKQLRWRKQWSGHGEFSTPHSPQCHSHRLPTQL